MVCLKMRSAEANISQNQNTDVDALAKKSIDDLKTLAAEYKTQLHSVEKECNTTKQKTNSKIHKILKPSKENSEILARIKNRFV
jgi:hypothetical protein